MAGVMAAHTLKSAGMNDFLLIEAAGRLGGRVSTTTFCGTREAIDTLCFAKLKKPLNIDIVAILKLMSLPVYTKIFLF